ncbi:MAG: hypothetical protein M3Y87_21525 [Myxococcota bacterium]|nr:hypothetical protein [Myxococcota bacterium]
MALALAAISWAPAARAQDAASVRETAAARALFREGVRCADRREWTCAVDRFHRAHEVRPSPVLAYNLGHALIESGRLVEGAEILQQLVRSDSAPASVRADARRVMTAAAPRIGRLTVRPIGSRQGVELSIDGHPLADSLVGAAAPVDPGERLVEARRGGEVVASARVQIAEGASETIELTLPDPPPAEVAAVAGAEAPVAVERSAHAVPSPSETARAAIGTSTEAPPGGGDDGPWIALGIGGAVVVVAGAVVLALVLSQPTEATAFDGNLGHVEIGR